MSRIASFFWGVSIFAYFFQVTFRFLSSLIVPCLAVFLIFSLFNRIKIDKEWGILFSCYAAYLCLMVAFSIYYREGLSRIARFFLILIVLPFFSLLKKRLLIWK